MQEREHQKNSGEMSNVVRPQYALYSGRNRWCVLLHGPGIHFGSWNDPRGGVRDGHDDDGQDDSLCRD